MIKKLRRSFISTAMIGVSLLLILLLGTINLMNIISANNGVTETLVLISSDEDQAISLQEARAEAQEELEEQDEEDLTDYSLTDPKNDYDTIISANFFVVRFDKEGQIVYTDIRRTSTVTEEAAAKMAKKVFAGRKEYGEYGKYRYRVANFPKVTSVVFLDTSDEIMSCIRVLFLSCAAGLMAWGVMLVLVIRLSQKAIAPVEESIEKQKQFISNAGHELKTPIAIIQANVEALELYTGDSKWSKNIKEQSGRLTELVKNLLLLSRLDEHAERQVSEFSMSELLEESVAAFAQVFEEKELTVQYEADPQAALKADRRQIENLIFILLDNAAKYADEKGTVRIVLIRKKQHVLLQVENTCSVLPAVPPQKLFERFYRADSSHNQKSGGSGIGLSMAEAIAEANKGTITAEYTGENRIRFTVRF